MEHSGFSFETVKSAMRYFEAAQLPAIVRVPSKSYHHIARAADMGAEGVMLPMVDTAAEARRARSRIKYTPLGARGVALGIAHDHFRGAGPVHEQARRRQRADLPVRARSRPPPGSSMPTPSPPSTGVDCLWVGHFDLSSSLGIPGQFEHPKTSPTRSTRSAPRRTQARQGARPARARRRQRHRPLRRAASTSSAIRATSGRCRRRCAAGSTPSGPAPGRPPAERSRRGPEPWRSSASR